MLYIYIKQKTLYSKLGKPNLRIEYKTLRLTKTSKFNSKKAAKFWYFTHHNHISHHLDFFYFLKQQFVFPDPKNLL